MEPSEVMQNVIARARREYNSTREAQVKRAILDAGYQVNDWHIFMKERATIVTFSHVDPYTKHLYIDGSPICSWSDCPNVEFDLSEKGAKINISIG